MGAHEGEILFERHGEVGLVTLNRPRALNALNLTMTTAMYARLEEWERDAAVTRVVVRGAGGRAFCAGGDIRRIHELVCAGRNEEVRAFWLGEYALNAYIERYSKPIVALVEGIVMGGGVGLAAHGSHRVLSDRITLAMPEVGIGFFPDVGMTWLLPRLPGRAGTYLALTGSGIGPGDALALGLATHYANATDFDAIVAGLSAGGEVDAVLADHAAAPPAPGSVVDHAATIDACFSGDAVGNVLARLDADGSAFAREAAAVIRTRSPHSLAIAFEQMRRGADMTFVEAMRTEYRLAVRAIDWPDFREGVRAAIVDKDNRPAWRPATLAEIDPAAIAQAFAPLPDGDDPRFDGSERIAP